MFHLLSAKRKVFNRAGPTRSLSSSNLLLKERMSDRFSPPINRSMKILDRSFFNKEVDLLAVRFPNPRFIGSFVKICKADILNVQNLKHVVSLGNGEKGVLLNDNVTDINTYKQLLEKNTLEKIKDFGASVVPYTMKLDYNFWKANDILKAVLPENLLDDIPTGFAQAGHVAHLNLHEDFKPFGELIGQVILDKNSRVETVVDKIDTIGTKFRTFPLKVLAGKKDLLVEQNESGCRFKFDFENVYWNSRLSTEHERLVDQFKVNEAVGDVFAGVGPFAIPAGKKSTFVLANDLNPESYKYLKTNISLNNTDDFVRPFNLDGIDFIKQSPKLLLEWAHSKKFITQKRQTKRRRFDTKENSSSPKELHVDKFEIPQFFSHYVMNLPDSAVSFLGAFNGLYNHPDIRDIIKNTPTFGLPKLHVHCFEKYSPDEQPEPSLQLLEKRVHQRIINNIGYPIPIKACQFHLVRHVAPTKPMFCVSFELPEEVAFR